MFKNKSIAFVFINAIVFITACNTLTKKTNTDSNENKNLAFQQTLNGLIVDGSLKVELVASEPMLKNPTNIDVDDRGRIWVTEAYNYRPEINGNPTTEKGDRIIILEDLNGDGIADTSKVFYQGPEINAPLGVCVLGNKVIISQSPYVWIFHDDDGDDKADRKEILFQGIGGEQHDHGMHTFTFGPDGKLYFNFGNEGNTLKDKNGKTVLDQDGDEIGPNKYQQGMIFRSNLDGTEVECLGQNFRNNYELAVDSYGNIWQSDNDDDGNRATRINFVMDYGNYGYRDEITKAYWSASRTNIEEDIPSRHWHLNDPGVVPNLLLTGAGSPTGIIFYEGKLLPKHLQSQMIHCDPGPNVVRAYPVKKQGAGYTAGIIDILKGDKDKWFRPSDICVAPDGSLIIADWYDPGVGGHQAGDQQKGRIYRISPKDYKYNQPKHNYTTIKGAIKALQSPNLAVRYLAWESLQKSGNKAIPELEKLWKSSNDATMRARAFWVLTKIGNPEKYINEAILQDSDMKILALRAARQVKTDIIKIIKELVNDNDPHVRRECAIALHHNKSKEMPSLWASLAQQHNGEDRWYLEALGIGAADQWEVCFDAYLKLVPQPNHTNAGKDIVWRARADKALPFLAELASDENTPLSSRLRYFRAFDFNNGSSKSKHLIAILEKNANNSQELNKLILSHLDKQAVIQSDIAKKALIQLVKSTYGSDEYISLVSKYQVKEETDNLLKLAIQKSNQGVGRNAASLLLAFDKSDIIVKNISNNDTVKTNKIVNALSRTGSKQSIDIIEKTALSTDYNPNIRSNAALMLGKSSGGEDRILVLLKNNQIPQNMIPYFVEGLKNTWRKAIYNEAKTYLPNHQNTIKNNQNLNLDELKSLNTNLESGKAILATNCIVCHKVQNEGFDFGPNLSEIGTKLPVEALLDAIVNPSAGISFGFETWVLSMKNGSTFSGIISSRTESEIELLYPGGIKTKINTNDIKSLKQLPDSMMPAGLHESMTKQELADMLAYLSSLTKK
jgi:putative membrane-bound dehydrogenase-like protein